MAETDALMFLSNYPPSFSSVVNSKHIFQGSGFSEASGFLLLNENDVHQSKLYLNFVKDIPNTENQKDDQTKCEHLKSKTRNFSI